MPVVEERRIRRIVVVFGGGADGGIESVVDSLLSKGEADVAGVFVEDLNVFRMAELPFATEVCRVTTVRRPVSTSELERQTKLLALRAERAIRRVAERTGARWSFRRYRGRLSAALADVLDVDLVVVGTARRTLAPAGELHATARTVRAAEAEARRPVIVVFDQTGPGDRALGAGIELAERTGRRLIVFLPASMDSAPPDLDRRLQSLDPARVVMRSVSFAEPSVLLSAVRRETPAIVVVGVDDAGSREDRFDQLRSDVSCPLVVVR
jgi:hypothetical protein